MTTRTITGASLAAALLAAAGCQAPSPLGYSEPSKALAPMERPSAEPGETWVARPVAGSPPAPEGEYRVTLAGVDGDTIELADNTGCEWTAPASGPGAVPRLAWSSACPDFTRGGGKTVRSVEGRLWPLDVGNRITYYYTGYTTAYGVYTGIHTCTVTGTARVTLSDGRAWDTYRVHCDDQEETWTWYFAPGPGVPVVYRYWLKNPQFRFPNSIEARYEYEYVRTEPPGESS